MSALRNRTQPGALAVLSCCLALGLPTGSLRAQTVVLTDGNSSAAIHLAETNGGTAARSDWNSTTLTLSSPAPADTRHPTGVISHDPPEALLFSFFREPNGQAGLQLATSKDGLAWTEIRPPNGKSFLEPKVGGKLMRDPCLALGPDGTFHMVWTTSWGRPPVFGYAESKNLIHWSEQRAIPVMENAPESKNVWAPELFYDAKQAEWLVFWASTVPGKFPETENSGDNNHRIYCVTTRDFQTFSPTRLFYDGGFNVIDATILAANGKFYLVVKDETKNPVRKNLHLAVADTPQGPFGKAGPAITGDWVEGPSAIRLGREFYIYFDHYTQPRYYGAVKSTDLEHWQDISSQVSFPRGVRHGTVLKVPEPIIRNLQNQAINPQPKP